MAIVLAIKDNITHFFWLEENKKKIVLKNYHSLDIQASEYYLTKTKETFDDIVEVLKHNFSFLCEDYQEEKLYVLLVAGSGHLHDFKQANIFDIGLSSETDPKKLKEEEIDLIKAYGLKLLKDSVDNTETTAVSVGSINKIGDGYYISYSFMSEEFIDGMCAIAESIGMQLFDIMPIAYTIPNAINNKQPYILELTSGYLGVCEDNYIAFQKYNTDMDDEQLLENFKSYLNDSFNIQEDITLLSDSNDIELRKAIDFNFSVHDERYYFLLGAIGIAYKLNESRERVSGEVKNGFIYQIKKFFTRNRKTES